MTKLVIVILSLAGGFLMASSVYFLANVVMGTTKHAVGTFGLAVMCALFGWDLFSRGLKGLRIWIGHGFPK